MVVEEMVVKRTNLECHVLPVRRIDSFDDRHSRLEFTPAGEQLTVECNVLRKFWEMCSHMVIYSC